MANMEQMPQNSHSELLTRPTEAEQSAPRRPTIEASIYCMSMLDNCARIAGNDSFAARVTLSRNERTSPFCICEMCATF